MIPCFTTCCKHFADFSMLYKKLLGVYCWDLLAQLSAIVLRNKPALQNAGPEKAVKIKPNGPCVLPRTTLSVQTEK